MKPSVMLFASRLASRCENCDLHQDDSPRASLHIEHIRPKKHDGTDDLDNLALACVDCNAYKGPNLVSVDPETGETVPLFNPRRHAWSEHFEWQGVWIVGKTAIDRSTVQVLQLNSEEHIQLRMVSR